MKTRIENDTKAVKKQLTKVDVPLGRIVATPGLLRTVELDDQLAALSRHRIGDWGDVCGEDWETNNWSLEHGARILSSYESPGGAKFWIITEADRSVTTLLLPSEY